MTKAKVTNFWNSRTGFVVQSAIALVLMYAIGSRAIDTGSLIEYFLTFLLLGVAINKLIKAIKN